MIMKLAHVFPRGFSDRATAVIVKRADAAAAGAVVAASGAAERRSAADLAVAAAAAVSDSAAAGNSAAAPQLPPPPPPPALSVVLRDAPKLVRYDDDCGLCLKKIETRRGLRFFLDVAFLGAEVPHLPEPIRRHVHALAVAGDEAAATTLECGHRYHTACLRAKHRNRNPLRLSEYKLWCLGCQDCQVQIP